MARPGTRSTNLLLTIGWVATGAASVTSGAAMIRSGWAPVVDNGLIAAMTVDSLSLDPPLVGMPTSLGFEGGAPLSHTGPLGLWLLALPTKLWGEPGHGLIIGSVILTLASIAGIAIVLRRRGDERLEAVGLLVVAAMAAAVGGAILADPFNPYIGVLPLLLCMLAVWGVLSQRHRQLYVMVVAGSLAAQTHLSYVPIVAALVVATSLSLAVDVRRSSGTARHKLTHRTIPVAVGLGVAAWIGPIIDQLIGSQNLQRLVRNQSGDQPTRGIGHGLELAVEMTSIPPRWITARAHSEVLNDPSPLRIALSVLAVAVVVGLGVWASRRGDRAMASLSLIAIVSLIAATFTSAREVNLGAFTDGLLVYRLFWWPVGAIFMLTLAWGVIGILESTPVSRTQPSRDRSGWRWAVPALVLCAVLTVPLGHRGQVDAATEFLRGDLAHAQAVASLPGSPDSVVLRFWPEEGLIPTEPISEFGYSTALIAQLRLRGIAVRFPDEGGEVGTFVVAYRSKHRAEGDEAAVILYRVGPAVYLDAPPGYRLISTTGPGPEEPLNPFDPPSAVYVRE